MLELVLGVFKLFKYKALGLHDIDWKSIIAKTVKPAFVDINLKAFDAGMAAARQ